MNNKSSGAIVWGTLLLGFGLFLFAKTMGWLNIDWSHILPYWPLLIVAAGLSVLANKSWSAPVAAVMVALAIPSGIINASHKTIDRIEQLKDDFKAELNDDDDNNNDDDDNSQTDKDYEEARGNSKFESNLSEPLPTDITSATLNFDSGAGKFKIEGTSNSLFEAKTNSELGNYILTNKRNDTNKTSELGLKLDGKKSISINGDNWDGIKNKVEMSLSDKPLWTINAETGACKMDFDLSAYKVAKLNLKTGVADVEIKLGDRVELSEIQLESGVSSVNIDVPESVGCEVIIKGGLNAKDLDNFEKISNGLYRTSNYDKASKKIKINYEGGISEVKINRY
jgi:Domain of unknown function (DUF5668)/N-terminal domain of toast_rack, DUF2154